MAKNILEIVFKTVKQGTGDEDAKRQITALQKSFKELSVVAGAFAGVAAAVTAALKFSTAEAMEAEKMQAKLSAVLKSTGGAAGLTQKSLNSLATELSRMSGIDDELIVNSEAVMLTFTQIGRQVFPQAMEAALNMSAVLGGDLQGSVVQLGKALNVTAGDTQTASLGLTAMRRSGVSFTEEQKKMALQMVKTGDVMGYQQLILEELNREFGGASKAMGDTTAGSSEKLKNSISNLAAAWGAQFLPSIKATNLALAESADAMTDNIEAANRQREATEMVAETYGLTFDQLKRARASSREWNETFEAQVAQLERGAAMTDFYTKQVDANTAAQKANEEALVANSDANKSMLSLIGNLQSEYESFTQKNEDLRAKLEELNTAQDKVPEWSKKYKDYQTQIEETEAEIRKLADEHEIAGKRIAFSVLQQKLASDGLTDAEFSNLLKLGESWGIYDKTVTESALLMNHNMELMADAMQEPWGMLKGINQQVNQIREKNGMAFDFYVNIHTAGAFPSLPVTMGGGGAGAPGGGPAYVAEAAGGQMQAGAWHLVGDAPGGALTPYSELISPSGYVFPADVTKHLLSSGLLGNVISRVAGGNILLDGVTNVTPTNFTNFGGTTFNQSSSNSGNSSVSSSVVTAEVNQAASAAQTTAIMAETAAAAVQTSASVQQSSAMQTQQLVSAITVNQSQIADLQRETNRLLEEQAKNLPREMAASLIQVMP